MFLVHVAKDQEFAEEDIEGEFSTEDISEDIADLN